MTPTHPDAPLAPVPFDVAGVTGVDGRTYAARSLTRRQAQACDPVHVQRERWT